MRDLFQDIRFGIRNLVHDPRFFLVAVLMLCLGIGGNSVIFSIVNAVLINPLPYKSPDRLVTIWETQIQQGINHSQLHPSTFLSLREDNTIFEDVGAMVDWQPFLRRAYGSESIRAASVSTNFFKVLGVEAIQGRTFLPNEDSSNDIPVVVLSHSFWQSRLGADPNILGKQLEIDQVSYTVIGILPPEFNFALTVFNVPPQFFRILEISPNKRAGRMLNVVARLKSGISLDQTRAETNIIGRQLEQTFPQLHSGWRIIVTPLHEEVVGHYRTIILTLFGATGILLLIACSNVSALLLARGTTRQREIAIRSALGATRYRLIRQLITESALLAIVGGMASVAFAMWGRPILLSLAPSDIPRLSEASINWQAFGFTFLISVVLGGAFGLAPSFVATTPNLVGLLRESGLKSTLKRHSRVLEVIVVIQVCLTLALLTSAGLMLRSYLRLRSVDHGLSVQDVLVSQIALPWEKYKENRRVLSFADELVKQVTLLPGVKSVSLAYPLPLEKYYSMRFQIEGKPSLDSQEGPNADFFLVDGDYFRTLSIPLTSRSGSGVWTNPPLPEIIINETMAHVYWPNQDPLGKHLILSDFDPHMSWVIKGVTKDIRFFGPDNKVGPQVYLPFRLLLSRYFYLIVRTSHNPEGIHSSLRTEIWKIDKDVSAEVFVPMEQMISDVVSHPRFNLFLLSVFSVVALFLAGVGIYGIVSYNISHRRGEIAIRIALGAQRKQVLKMVAGQGLRATLIGIIAGVAMSLGFSLILRSQLYEITPTDPLTLLCTVLILSGLSLSSAYISTWKLTRGDLLPALKEG